MRTVHDQIANLSDKTAIATLELVLRRAGLAPDPFAKDPPDNQLREALAQLNLPPLEGPPTTFRAKEGTWYPRA
jgi:hypothetical protein